MLRIYLYNYKLYNNNGGGKMSILSEKIIFYRKQKKLTQREMAKKLKISQPGYAKYESGLAEPDVQRLNLLSEIFNISLDDLMKNSCNNLLVKNQDNDLGVITAQQSQLFKMIQKLDNDRFFMVYGYTERLLREMI